jgi:hypothetical protein
LERLQDGVQGSAAELSVSCSVLKSKSGKLKEAATVFVVGEIQEKTSKGLDNK